MAVTITIRNLPDATVERLKEQAKRNHRSLQGEVRAILEQSALGTRLSAQQVYERARARGIATESSVEIIREMRDGRYGE